MDQYQQDPGDELSSAVELLVSRAGPDLRVAAPLALGKPHRLLNALFHRVKRDPSLKLKVFTALSLSPPTAKGELAARFLNPFSERFFGLDFEVLEYAKALAQDALPANMRHEEFYMASGSMLASKQAQQGYASVNYTHVARGLARQGIGGLVQKVARGDGGRLSLSCNPDLTLDLIDEIARLGKPRPCLVAEVDPELPYIGGSAEVPADYFDLVIDLPRDSARLFALPRGPVSDADYAIGIYASALVRDGGTLQIGIGTLSDALAQALILRHTDNAEYLKLLETLEPGYAQSELVREIGGTGPFELGLYGASEMVNDAFRVLRAAGVLKRQVVEDADAMERLNAGTPTTQDRELLESAGHFLDGAFYLGSVDLYEWLRNPPPEDRGKVGMTRVSHINQLYGGNERLERAQRRDARFFNTCMVMTALGSAASDTLEDGRVVSGVGGQYNFVAMAHTLQDSRSALMFRSTHGAGAALTSSIRWQYGNCTIPRHLRDIAITEYGVADLRDQCDEQCIKSMLALTAEEFQEELVEQAKAAGKLDSGFVIPPDITPNTPLALHHRLRPMRATGRLPDYPHGCDFTEVERRLVPALQWMKSASARPLGKLRLLAAALLSRSPAFSQELERMGFMERGSLSSRLARRTLRLALARCARSDLKDR